MGRIQAVATAEPPARSPERQRLADAIATLAGAKSALSHIRDVIGFQVDKGLEADRTLREALAHLEELGADDARALSAAALGDDAGSHALREARDAVEAAREQVKIRETTRQRLRDREEEADKAVATAETTLKTAHLAALSADPSIANLMARWAAARRTLLELRPIMVLCGAAFPHGYIWETAEAFERDIPCAESTRWKAAIEKLKSDADHELP